MIRNTFKQTTKTKCSSTNLAFLLFAFIQFSFSSTTETETWDNPSYHPMLGSHGNTDMVSSVHLGEESEENKAYHSYKNAEKGMQAGGLIRKEHSNDNIKQIILEGKFSSYTEYYFFCLTMASKKNPKIFPFLYLLQDIFTTSEKHFFFKILNERQFAFGYLHSYPTEKTNLRDWVVETNSELEPMLSSASAEKKSENCIIITEKAKFVICNEDCRVDLIEFFKSIMPEVGVGNNMKNKSLVKSAFQNIIQLLKEPFHESKDNKLGNYQTNFYVSMLNVINIIKVRNFSAPCIYHEEYVTFFLKDDEVKILF